MYVCVCVTCVQSAEEALVGVINRSRAQIVMDVHIGYEAAIGFSVAYGLRPCILFA